MKKRVIVISLGGSLIIPNEADVVFLKKFREVIKNNTEKYKFVIVCGGGSIARKYINALREIGVNEKLQSMSGISATRMNARFMTYFFGEDAGQGIPHDMKKVRNMLLRNNIVFCGALRYEPKQTSDATAAKLANYFKTEFINLTNVQGLHDKNPKKFKNAKFIPFILWKDFDRMANKEEYKPGQHFVLDQTASKIILKNKITTYILGKDLRQLNSLLKNRKFTGTVIKG